MKKIENKNFQNWKIAINNQKIDFDKNRILTPLCKQNLKKMMPLVKIGRVDHEISAYTDTHTHTHTHTSIRTFSKNSVFRFQIC